MADLNKMRHAHIHMRGIRGVALVEMGGPALRITDAAGKTWAFEDHRYCGPSALKADGSTPADPQPGPKSEFWSCVSLWAQQGRRRAADGSCLWDAVEAQAKARQAEDNLLRPTGHKEST